MTETIAEGWEGTELSVIHNDETHETVLVVSRDRADGTVEYLVSADWWVIADATEDPAYYAVARIPCHVYRHLAALFEQQVIARIGTDFNSYIHTLLGFPPEESFSSDEPF